MNRTLRQRSTVLLAAASALALAGCSTSGTAAESEPSADASAAAAPETVSVEHAQGTAEVPVDPEMLITFDLGFLDSMEAVGEEAQGLPKGSLPEQFAKYDAEEYVNAGSMKEPDLEAVAEADPDVIIISGRTADFYDELSEIAPTVDLSADQSDPVGAFKKQAEVVGQVFGKEAEVEEKVAAVEQQIAETQEQAADAGTALFLLTSGGEVNAYGENSRFGNILHGVLGLEPAAEVNAEGTHGEAISFEAIAEADPDRLYVLDRDAGIGSGGEAAQQVLDNELVNGTAAAQQDRITYVDSASWYLVGPGLNNFPAMIGEVQESLS